MAARGRSDRARAPPRADRARVRATRTRRTPSRTRTAGTGGSCGRSARSRGRRRLTDPVLLDELRARGDVLRDRARGASPTARRSGSSSASSARGRSTARSTRACADRSRTRRCSSSTRACRNGPAASASTRSGSTTRSSFCASASPEAIEGGVWIEISDLQRRELEESMWRDLESFVREEAESPLGLVPRKFEVAFGSDRSAPELQSGLRGRRLRADREDRPDRRRPVQRARDRAGLQVGQEPRSRRRRSRSELRLQIPLYMLVLRTSSGWSRSAGSTGALAGERRARGLLRAEAEEDVPGFVEARLPRGGRVLGADRAGEGARDPLRRADPLRGRSARPEGRVPVPDLVRSLGDVPGGPDMTVVDETRTPRRRAARGDRRGRARLRLRGRGHREDDGARRALRAAPCANAGFRSTRCSRSRTRSGPQVSCAAGSAAASRSSTRHDLARQLDGAWISTIHGFCHRLLKAHPFEAAVDPSFRVLDENQARVLAGEAFDLGARGVLRVAAIPSASDCWPRTGRGACAEC